MENKTSLKDAEEICLKISKLIYSWDDDFKPEIIDSCSPDKDSYCFHISIFVGDAHISMFHLQNFRFYDFLQTINHRENGFIFRFVFTENDIEQLIRAGGL